MTIDLDLVIATKEDSVDMKSGLTSMQGVSDAVRCIAEGVLAEKVPERQTSKSNVRTSLKKSFKGSYGQIFSLDINNEDLKKRLNRIGHAAFIEIIGYFISEALYKEPEPISPKAENIVNNLGDIAEKIVQQLRVSSLENIHDVSIKFDHDVLIRHRINRDRQKVIASFDKHSATALHAEVGAREVDLSVVVTRLNIHTGNGRIQIEGEDETTPFGFARSYQEIATRFKKIFSHNLDHNNGIAHDKWIYLRIAALPVKLKDGRIIKYIINKVHNEN